MAFEAQFPENYDPDKGSFDDPAPGRYHAIVVSVDEDGEKSGAKRGEMVVEYEILAGTVPGQEGKRYRDYFSKNMAAQGRIHQFGMAIGATTAEELKRLKAEGKGVLYDFPRDGTEKQVCIELKEEEYNGKKRAKCGFGIYHIQSEKVASWPKNAGYLAKIGIDPTAAPAASAVNGNGAPKPSSPPAAVTPSASSSAVDDLLAGVV